MPNQAAFVDKSPRHWSGVFRSCRAVAAPASGGVVLEWRKASVDRNSWSCCEPPESHSGVLETCSADPHSITNYSSCQHSDEGPDDRPAHGIASIRAALVFNSCGSSLPKPNSRLGAELKVRERVLTRTLKGEPCPGLASHRTRSSGTATLEAGLSSSFSGQPELGRVMREELKAFPVGGVRPPQRVELQPLQRSDPRPKTTQSEGP
jgi:hypothetical protein